MANFIKGRVFDERSRRPVPGLTIDAFTQRTHESLGIAQTNADGVFGVAVDPRRFKALVTSGERIGFRVTGPNGEEYIVSGGGVWSGREPDEVVSVVVRPPTVESTTGGVGYLAGRLAGTVSTKDWARFVQCSSLNGKS